ncbi:MAG: pyridoxal phosphate enzyme (YggS family) [Sphingobacteriales bacterium]|jgi:pyridoxal phosphate enzyme (YggS family)
MTITEKFDSIKDQVLSSNVEVLPITKKQTVKDIQTLYDHGQRAFGENLVQEILEKKELLPNDIEWHMVGHLQSNKVKQIAPFIHLIHSVDSFKLLKEINKHALKNNRVISCLFEVKIADEESKYGFSFEDLILGLSSGQHNDLPGISIAGLMGIATYTSSEKMIKEEFYELATLFKGLKLEYFKDNDHFTEISMGMSGDYPIAVKEGSTIIRVGSSIFGKRKK